MVLSLLKRNLTSDTLRIAVFGLLYFIAHLISFFFPDTETALMSIWPAGGISLAAFLLIPKRLWPTLAITLFILGIFADVVFAHRSVVESLGYMFANMAGSVACAWVVIRKSCKFTGFETKYEVWSFLFAVIIVNGITSCLGALTSFLIKGALFRNAWFNWYIADGLGMLVIGPIMVCLLSLKKFNKSVWSLKTAEAMVFLAIWSVLLYIIFLSNSKLNQIIIHPYLLVALIVWPAVRFGLYGVTLAVVAMAIITIIYPAIAMGPSPFISGETNHNRRLTELQVFIFFIAVVGYIIAAGYSDLKRTESYLRESEEKFKAIFENSQDAIGISLAGINVFCNNAYLKLFGYESNDEIVGKSLLEQIAPSERAKIAEYVKNRMAEENAPNHYETVGVKKNGEEFSFEINTGNYVLNDKKYTIGIIRDTADRKRAEFNIKEAKERAEESEEKLRLMLKNSNDTFVLINKEGEQIYISDAAVRDTGYSIEELKGPIQKVIYPDDLEYVLKAWNEVLAKKGQVIRVQYRHIHKYKEYIWYEAAAQNFIDNPAIKAVVVNVRDISLIKETEQELLKAKEKAEESEEKYRLLLSNISDLVCEIDENGVYTYVNDNFKDILGYEKEELLGKQAIELIHPDDLLNSIKKHETIKNELGRSVDIWRFKHKNGEYRTIESKGAVYKNSKNELRTVVISRDITAQRQSEIDLQVAKEKAEESDRLKTAFLQNMSHEIRTPMNAIKGFADLLAKQYNNKEKLEKFAGIISQRSSDLLDIINDILDISRIESGQLLVNYEECDVNVLFEELSEFFTEFQKKIGKQHIKFSLHNDCNPANQLIVVDKIKLKQVFINLITNAFKFTDEGKIEVGCKLLENRSLLFYVSDTGIGIPMDKQKMVFERFAQLNQNPKKNIGGTGLGLSIVSGLVSLLGGTITLQSEPGKGSTFSFSLPLIS